MEEEDAITSYSYNGEYGEQSESVQKTIEIIQDEQSSTPTCTCSSSICFCTVEPKKETTDLLEQCLCPPDAVCTCAVHKDWGKKKRAPDPCVCPSDTLCVCTVVPDICTCPGDTICACRASKASLVAKRLAEIAPCICPSDTVCTCVLAGTGPEEPEPIKPPCVCPTDTPCVCYLARSSEIEISSRKLKLLNTVKNTEKYLREHCILNTVQFLLTKLVASGSEKPSHFLEKLLDDCMLYRAGYGEPPVIYEDRHLKAVVKSFDPLNRGWVTASQVRRAYITLGLTPREIQEERISCVAFFDILKSDQEKELMDMLRAGIPIERDPV